MKFDPGHGPSLKLHYGRERPAHHRRSPKPSFDLVVDLPPSPGPGTNLVESLRELVDGFSEQVAIVDEDWTILVTNQPWNDMVRTAGYPELLAGTNYFHFLETSALKGHKNAVAVMNGIATIQEGASHSFQLTYAGVDQWEGRTLQVRISPLHLEGRRFTTIARQDISAQTDLRRLREEFSSSVIQSQADERRRLGREVHDSTMQLLACLGMMIAQLKGTCQTAQCKGIIDEMSQLLGEAQQEIRSLSYLAHPPQLDKMTLAEALQAIAEGFGRRTGLQVQFELVGEPHMSSPAGEAAFYRVVQEALSNVHRHSRATHATVRLSQGHAMSHIVISDDGIGMPSRVSAGVGLSGMRSRMAELGGRLFIRARSPGTAVIASLPSEKRVPLGEDQAVLIPA